MIDLDERLVKAIADGQAATGKPVSLTVLRASIRQPPMPPDVQEAVASTLARLARCDLIELHVEADGGTGYTLTLDGWRSSPYREKADKVVDDMLAVFRAYVQLGKGDYKSFPWQYVKETGKVGDGDINLYVAVCHQARLMNGFTSPRSDSGQLMMDFTRPNDFEEIVHLSAADLLARRTRERREQRLAGRTVPRDARIVMSRAYEHVLKVGEWPLTKTFNVELRRAGVNLVDVATAYGKLIRGTDIHTDGQRTHLTLRAVALLEEAEAQADALALARMIQHLAVSFDRDQSVLDLPARDVASAAAVDDPVTIARLLRVLGEQGSPFLVKGKPEYRVDTTTVATGPELLDFIGVQNLDEVGRALNEREQTYGVPLSPPSPVVAMPPSIELPPLDVEPSLDSAVTEQRGVRKTPCAVVLTALPVEYKAVRALLVGLQEVEHRQGTIYERGRFARGGRVWDVVIGQIGQGNQRAASAAERAISRFEPEVAMFVGIAGGVKDVKLGDVVAATSVHGYEAGKAKAKEFLPRPDAGRSSFRMEERAKFEATKERWKELSTEAADATAHVAPIAAGEKVVASNRSAVAKFLKKAYSHVLAVEMEGRGFLEATHANHLDAIVVRGISDLLSKKEESDTAGWQERAARNAAAFALHTLSRFSPPTLPFFVPPDNGGDDSSDSGRSPSTEGGLLDREKIATEHDLAKRLSAALYKLTEARSRLVVDLRQLDSASPLGSSLAARAPAHAATVDEIVHLVEQLKVEARVVWGAQLAALVSKVQKGTNDLVRYVSAKLADDTFALIAYCTTDDELTYSGTAYSQRMDQLADLLQTWLGFLIRRESGERMSWETLAQRQQSIERETAELGAKDFNKAHDEYIEGTADAAAAYEEHCAAEQVERERFDAIELDPRRPEAPRIRRVTASSPAIVSNRSEPDDV